MIETAILVFLMTILIRRSVGGLCPRSLETFLATDHLHLNLYQLRALAEILQDLCASIDRKMTLGINHLRLMDLSRLFGTGNGIPTNRMPTPFFTFWMFTSN